MKRKLSLAQAVEAACILFELNTEERGALAVAARAGLPVATADEQAAFDAVDMGKGVLSQAELLAHRLPEMPASLVPIIEEIWLAEVVGK